MSGFLDTLTQALEGAPLVALGAALLWGVLSVILSPCHLASIPLLVGYIAGQGLVKPRRAFILSTLFALGLLLVIALIGVITAALGRIVGDLGGWTNYLVAAVFFLMGLSLLGVIPLPSWDSSRLAMRRKGLLGAFLLGLFFGLALGPCTFAFMAPALVVTFRLGATAPLYAAILLLAYGLGHCAVIIVAGTSVSAVQGLLRWNESSRGGRILRVLCGLLVLAGGLYLIFTAR
ncbi:MAG: cytochrome C biogenesis protein [Coprothermobacterota bacterium]|nr:cytochrome C biogenesis protein [Coprothermobacterota bacterium]